VKLGDGHRAKGDFRPAPTCCLPITAWLTKSNAWLTKSKKNQYLPHLERVKLFAIALLKASALTPGNVSGSDP
jgi:hypothetical protein